MGITKNTILKKSSVKLSVKKNFLLIFGFFACATMCFFSMINTKEEKKVGKISRILRVFTFVFGLFFVGNALAAGYTCTKTYTRCNTDYYLTASGANNSCAKCPTGTSNDDPTCVGSSCCVSDNITVTCSAGKYIAQGATTCSSNPARTTGGKFAPGGTYTIPASGATADTGLTSCPGSYVGNDSAASSNANCYLTTTPGKYVGTTNSSTQSNCTANYFCPGGVKVYYGSTGGRNYCRTVTGGWATSAAGSDEVEDCYRTVLSGNYLDDNGDLQSCPANDYCPGATLYYPNTGGNEDCPSSYPYSDGGTTAKSEAQCYTDCSVTCSGNNTGACPDNATCTYDTTAKTSGRKYSGGTCDATAGLCPVKSFTCKTGYEKSTDGTSCVPKTVQCSEGYYLKAGSTYCSNCPANSWCPGGDYTYSATGNQGINSCPDDYPYSSSFSDAITDCYANATHTASCSTLYRPSGCSAATCSCTYKDYYDTEESSTPCTASTVVSADSAKANYYVNGTTCPACSDASSTYIYSDGGNIASGRCYTYSTKTGTCASAYIPSGCSTAQCECEYKNYASGTDGTCTLSNVTSVTAKANYYANSSSLTCPACSTVSFSDSGSQSCSITNGSGTQTYSRTCYRSTSSAGATSSSQCSGSQNCGTKTLGTCYVSSCDNGYSENTAGTACEGNNITISYDEAGGSTVSDSSCKYGGSFVLPSAPSRTGYTFGGWLLPNGTTKGSLSSVSCTYANLQKYSGTATITATWSVKSYSCNAGYYLPAGATSCSKCECGYACSGGTYSYNASTTQGRSQCQAGTYSSAGASSCTSASKGYYVSSAGACSQSKVEENCYADTTGSTSSCPNSCPDDFPYSNAGATSEGYCYANCTTSDVTGASSVSGIKYSDGIGDTCKATSCSANRYLSSGACPTCSSQSASYPSSSGGTNGGGYCYKSCASKTGYSLTSGVDYYSATDTCSYEACDYTIKYNANGGSGTMANTSATYDTSVALRTNTFTKTGCTFTGWATTSNGSVAYTDGKSVINLTSTCDGTVNLYAVWSCWTISAPNKSLTYNGTTTSNGSAQSCGNVTVSGATGTTVKYKTSSSASYSTTVPTLTNVGSVTVYYEVSKTGYTSQTGSYTCTMGAKNMTVSAPTKTLTYSGSAQSCANVSVSVPSSGASVTYSSSANGTFSATAPTLTNAGSTTVYYKVTGNNFNNASGSYTCKVNAATGSTVIKDGSTNVTNSEGTTAYPGTKSLTVTCAGGATATITNSATAVATASISSNTISLSPKTTGSATITVTCPATTNYNSSSATYKWTVSSGTISATATNKSKTYDGSALSCAGISGASDATVEYSTDGGSTWSTTVPSRTNAGTTTVNYRISKTYYTTSTGSFTCSVSKAANPIAISSESGSIAYPNSGTFTVSGAQGALSVSSSNTGVATASVSGTTVTMTSVKPSTSPITITVTAAGNDNYNSGSKTYSLTVNKGTNTLTLSASEGSATYPLTKTFTISKNTSGGTLSVVSGNTGIATVSLSGTTVTMTPKATGTVTITVTSAATDYYNSKTATYQLTVSPGTIRALVSNKSKTYDGSALSCAGISGASDATVEYSTDGGSTWSTTVPSRTNAGTTTVNYRISKTYYTTSTGSFTCSVSKAANPIAISSESGSIAYPNSGTFTVSGAQGTLFVATSNTGVATASVSGTTVTMQSVKPSTSPITITVRATGNDNYNSGSKTYSLTVNKGTNPITISSTSGNMEYSSSSTFSVSNAQGALSVTSSASGVATASVSGTTVTVSSGASYGTATITVTAAGNDYYNSGSKTYAVTVDLGKITLNNQSATSAGTTTIYQKYNTNVYLDAARSKAMTTSANAITVPTKTGYTFGGYYDSTSYGTQYIDASGKITSSGVTAGKALKANGTWYAKWTVNSYSCDAGWYLPAGATSCSKCECGYACSGGNYSYNASTTQGRSQCLAGTYSSAGASSCSPAGKGYYVDSAGACEQTKCSGTKYSDSTGATSCTVCPNSATGYWDWSGDGLHDRVYECYKNVPWTTDNGSGTQNCYYTSGSGTSAVYAGNSNAGCDSQNVTKCDAGYYKSATTKCSVAGTGYYSPADDTSRYACTDTYANTTTTTTTASAVSQCVCKAGYGGTSSSSCTICAKGYYKSGAGNTTCSIVDSGCYADTTGSTSKCPSSCPSGASGSDGGRDAKTDCYVSCSAKTISNGTTTVVNAKEYYTGSAYPACTYNVNCNAKYGASGNKTSNPSCTACGTGTYSGGGTATCAGCPDGYKSGSAASTQSGCVMNVAGGKYVAKANESAASGTCANWTYMPEHTVNYGSTSSCTGKCPTVTSGWTKGTGTGWSAVTQCYQTKTGSAISSYCNAGVLQQNATSETAWGSPKIATALGAVAGAIVSGQTCTQCDAGTYSAGGTNTACGAISKGCFGGAGSSVACPNKCSAGTYRSSTGGKTQADCSTLNDACYGSAGATSACPNSCDDLTAPAVTGGTFSSVTPRDASTQCRYVAPAKTDTECSSITANTVSYTSSGWGTNFYTALAKAGSYVTATGNTSAPACATCAAGKYQGSNGSSKTSCDTCANWTFSGEGASSCTACPALTSGWSKVDSTGTGWTTYASCKQKQTPANCSAGVIQQTATSATAWGGSSVTTALKASQNYYVNNTACSACSGLGGGLYKNSASGNTGGASACYATTTDGKYISATSNTALQTCPSGDYCPATTLYWSNTGGNKDCPSGYTDGGTGLGAQTDCKMNVAGGKYVANANESAASGTCANWTYMPEHTVNYGSTSSCTGKCPTVTSGWTKGTGTGWSAVTQCYQTKTGSAISSYCNAGVLQQNATSETAWGSPKIATALGAVAGAIVSGQTCTQCDAGTYSAGGTNTACGAISKGCFGGAGSSVACPNKCSAGTYRSSTGGKTQADCSTLNDACYGSAGATSACPNSCDDLTAPAVTGGTFSSVTPRDASTQCRYVAPAKTDTECSSITANTVSYTSSGWGTNFYTALAKAGSYVTATGNTSAPACATCAAGKYQGSNGSSKTSCDTCANWTFSGEGASSCTACPAVPDAVGGVAWTKASGTGWKTYSSCVVSQTPVNCASGSVKRTATSATAWGSTTLVTQLKSNAGYYASSTATSCTVCPAGSFCPASATSATACALGSYTGSTGKSACTACTNGTTTSGTGKTSCDATCANNNSYDNAWATASWSNNSVANLCKISNCKAGSSYSSATGTNYAGSCTQCSAGTYVSSSAHTTTSCSNVTAGCYGSAGATTSCPTVCATDKWSNAGASACTDCATEYGYHNSGTTPASHAGIASCKVVCGAGTYVPKAGEGCVNVGAGYWGAGGTVAENATLARGGQCTAPLTTIGYGTGANEADDCGRKLHAGSNVVYLRSEQRSTPTLKVKVGDKTFFGALSESLSGALKVNKDGKEYSVVNDWQ